MNSSTIWRKMFFLMMTNKLENLATCINYETIDGVLYYEKSLCSRLEDSGSKKCLSEILLKKAMVENLLDTL